MKKSLQLKLTAAIMAIQLTSGVIVSLILLFSFLLDVRLLFVTSSPLILPLLCLVISLLFSALISVPVSRYILRPIRQLNDATFRVAQGDFWRTGYRSARTRRIFRYVFQFQQNDRRIGTH